MDFQFLRIEWLWMLLPLFLLAWLVWHKRVFSRDWAAVIDAQLLPHLLVGKKGRRSLRPLLFWLSLAVLSTIALAGPVWKKLPLPVFQQQSALVILLDLSSSMDADDIKPSRLARARLKMIDLLSLRREGQTALVAFAATAYTVSPLTDDTDTIQSLVASLTTDIMPVQGSRADLAVQKALELFHNAGIAKGDILLISDGVNDTSVKQLQGMDLTGFRVSILAVGSEEGAPIPGESGAFIKDDKGSIVIARTNHAELRSLSSELGGIYHAMSIDDSDLIRLVKLLDGNQLSADRTQTDFSADRWREEGPWLLLLVTPLAALAFRRGIFLSLLLAFMLLPMPQPVLALDLPEWESLWKNTNQRAEQSLQQGDAENAARLFERQDWKAAAHYKAGEYEQALEQLTPLQSPENIYNRANTLAKMGRLQEALDSYDEVLKKQPQHEDAAYNRKLVEQALKQQQQQNDQNKDDQQQNDQQQGDQKQGEDQPSQQQSAQQDSEQQAKQDKTENKNAAGQPQEKKQDSEQQQKEQAKQDEKQDEAKKADSAQAKQQQDADARPLSPQESTEKLSEQAEAQWLRRIPDDPGGLLRNKFRYQYSRQQQPSREKEPW